MVALPARRAPRRAATIGGTTTRSRGAEAAGPSPPRRRAHGEGRDRLGGRTSLTDPRILASGGDHRHLSDDLRHHEDDHLLHVRLPLRHPRPPEGRPHPLHRGQSRPSGEPRRAVRQRLRRHHEPLLPCPPHQAPAAHRRARRRRLPRDRVGGGAGARRQMAGRHPRHGAAQAGDVHRPRPEPVLHRLVGQAVRHSQLRRTWRLLLRQHGGRRPVFHRRQLLGVRRAGLGAHQIPADVRCRRGPRLQPDQARHSPS